MTPWPYATLSFVTTSFILIGIYLIWRKFRANNKTSIFLELTTASDCELVLVASLPLCPHNWTIFAPTDIRNVRVHGKILPLLTISWDKFSIINNYTKACMYTPNTFRISPLQARSIKRIIQHPFTAYLIMTHHGYFQMLQ